jgi:hypothetical protein
MARLYCLSSEASRESIWEHIAASEVNPGILGEGGARDPLETKNAADSGGILG